jgi:hypothetical protein
MGLVSCILQATFQAYSGNTGPPFKTSQLPTQNLRNKVDDNFFKGAMLLDFCLLIFKIILNKEIFANCFDSVFCHLNYVLSITLFLYFSTFIFGSVFKLIVFFVSFYIFTYEYVKWRWWWGVASGRNPDPDRGDQNQTNP